jgi:hypothetical protein
MENLVTTPATPDEHLNHPCWPDDTEWHHSHTRIELPSEKHLRAYWHAEILDVDSPNPHDRIIERDDPFVVRIRVELVGRLWRCITGNWCFDIGFTVPKDTIPVECCGTVYECAAWFELRCCGTCRDKDSHLAASGFERFGEYQFV